MARTIELEIDSSLKNNGEPGAAPDTNARPPAPGCLGSGWGVSHTIPVKSAGTAGNIAARDQKDDVCRFQQRQNRGLFLTEPGSVRPLLQFGPPSGRS